MLEGPSTNAEHGSCGAGSCPAFNFGLVKVLPLGFAGHGHLKAAHRLDDGIVGIFAFCCRLVLLSAALMVGHHQAVLHGTTAGLCPGSSPGRLELIPDPSPIPLAGVKPLMQATMDPVGLADCQAKVATKGRSGP